MSKEESELIISNSPEADENTMYILPSNLSSLKFLSSNTFDFCLIKDCPVSSLTSLSLSQIFRIMKYESRVEILISQPITVMQALDSKQIKAHCEHVGFENISIENENYIDEKHNKKYPTLAVVCFKPNRERDGKISKISNNNKQTFKTKNKNKK